MTAVRDATHLFTETAGELGAMPPSTGTSPSTRPMMETQQVVHEIRLIRVLPADLRIRGRRGSGFVITAGLMMIYPLQTLLLWGSQLVLSSRALTAPAPTDPSNFFYHNFLNGNGTKDSMFTINNNILHLNKF